MSSRPRRRGPLARLYHGESNIDFLGRAKYFITGSIVVILVGLALMVGRGLNLGIDFEGGTSWTVPGTVDIDDAREVMASLDLPDAEIQVLGGTEGEQLRVQTEPGADTEAVREALAELAGVEATQVQVTDVSPSWGSEITEKALRALVFFLAAIMVYISLRFEWRMAVATVVALLHDIALTLAVYSLTGFEVTPATVVAILTILGYSIYDGIVVFDRVDENARVLANRGDTTYRDMVNTSLNQVFMRTMNTSITALLPVASLLIIGSFVLGAATLQEFALALLVGLAAGTYSSPIIASPVLAALKEREPRYTALRKRLESRRPPLVPTGGSPAPARATVTAADGGDGNGDDGDGVGTKVGAGSRNRGKAGPVPASTPGGGITPRPRKKGKKR
ncbi:MAG TPA: protein translocase subunit SecF [Acidimicrobiales bacterium]|jgi:preprotein translocase subunit SecF|nr:protein translocase subunit SecF [Acidimicrobiales bacterium]